MGGMHFKCPGVSDGEMIVELQNDSRALYFAMMASDPNLSDIVDLAQDLIYEHFTQCILIKKLHKDYLF